MSEVREQLLWGWACIATVCAAGFFAYWRLAEHFYRVMRDGWRDSLESHRETLARVDELATARAERMTAEAALTNALREGAEPQARA
ncbi:hypothetical protein Mx9_p68 [Myxococcus phage Mx9]|nr:hypothetical protein Mx9_p68 [Myxococcus phage Mx9]